MSSEAALQALAIEAKRRGTSYGKLMGRLSYLERNEIVRKYLEEKGGTGRRKKKAARKE